MDDLLDVAIVGAGIGGVIHLHYARQAGLRALVLEREDACGGLWRTLPAWQDIQISPPDWALADLPLAGPLQPQILANIQAWVDRFGLADGIRYGSPVTRAAHDGGAWLLDTPTGRVRARHLVAACGGHARPVVPAVPRRDAVLRELHSSALREPTLLRGRDVLVVGGGASAFDLLDQAVEQGARRIHWAFRGLRWFMPTTKPKTVAGSVRGFARLQASGQSPSQQSATIGADLRGRYAHFGIEELLPARPFDVLHDQLMPGRARMLANFGRITRHRASVEAIRGHGVTLTSGARVDADLLLWGTGYAVDLGWLDVPALAGVRSVNALAARCGGIFRSLDAPDLYFPGVGLDGIGAAPWAYCLLARTIASHIRGTARLDLAPVGHKVNHFDLVDYLAARDPGSYPPDGAWRDRMRRIQLETPDGEPYPLP